ncbi:MAG TPA: hypothetical protein PLN69_12600 [bacterium]|nr:hypothetical protein [bacterium]
MNLLKRKKVLAQLRDEAKFLPRLTDLDKKLIDDLRAEIRSLPKLKAGPADSGNDWISNRLELRMMILKSDPRLFLNWDVIKRTMLVGNPPYVDVEEDYLKSDPVRVSKYKSIVSETSSIVMPGLPGNYHKSRGNMVHHAYHLAVFEEKTGRKIEDYDSAFEFGGGFGGLCAMSYGLGFNGAYTVFDSDEFSALQKYYLDSVGVSRCSGGACCISGLQAVRELENRAGGCFIATWSLSETPVGFRAEFVDAMPDFDAYLIAFQDRFFEVDNVAYFEKFAADRPGFEWQTWKIPHIEGNRYLIGVRK